MIILGIDPGYERLGVAIIDKGEKGEILLYSDCIKTTPDQEFTRRLFIIGEEVEKIIKKFKPERLAIENLFFNTNQKTATKVSEVKGVMSYIALRNKMDFFEYTPLQIKNAISGYGRGDKRQVIDMLCKLIKIDKKIKYDDEYDAIAVAVTCGVSER